jgi:uncharacterized protein (DUF983 family)
MRWISFAFRCPLCNHRGYGKFRYEEGDYLKASAKCNFCGLKYRRNDTKDRWSWWESVTITPPVEDQRGVMWAIEEEIARRVASSNDS